MKYEVERDRGRVRGLGGEGVQPGDGGPWAIAGSCASGGRAVQIRMASPSLSSSTLWGVSRRRRCLDTQHSTLAPEGRVVLTT